MNKIFCLLSIILLAIAFGAKAQDTLIVDKVVGIVGNKIILHSEVEAQYLQAKARRINTDRCKVFEELLYQKLLISQAEVDSIEVSDKEVEAELKSRIQESIDQMGGVQKMEEFFNKPISEIKENLRDVTKDQLVAQRMKEEITKDIKVTPAEVNNYYKTLNKDSLPLIELQYEFQQIVLYPKISQKEKDDVKKRLLDIKKQVLEGKMFETMAILYSEDPGSATKGGELGFMSRGELVPEFSAAAFSLKKDSISDVIESEFGYHIIQMVDRKGERINVRHILMKPKYTQEALKKAKQVADSIYSLLEAKKFTFDDAAKYFSMHENTAKNGGLMINPYLGTAKFEVDHIYPSDMYNIKNLSEGQFSKPFGTYDEKANECFKIILVKQKTPAHQASIETDYQIIQNMALENKYHNAYDEWIKEKQKTTYIKISPQYLKCNFNYKGWLEKDFQK